MDYYENTEFDRAYLVLENAGEKTLHQFVKENQSGVELEQIKSIMRQLCQAIEFLHHNKICHRDLKPDNMMITKHPDNQITVKLIDFNIAFDFSEQSEIFGAEGLRHWSAPETRKLEAYNESCDLWSLGCILYLLCTGHKPFDDNEPMLKDNQIEEATKKFYSHKDYNNIKDLLTLLLTADI